MRAILDNLSLCNDTENGWVHKKGGSLQSGFKHATQIASAALKYSTPMTQLDLVTFLGVKEDNHNVVATLLSLVREKSCQHLFKCTKPVGLFLYSSNQTFPYTRDNFC